jgi:hypothetical protein
VVFLPLFVVILAVVEEVYVELVVAAMVEVAVVELLQAQFWREFLKMFEIHQYPQELGNNISPKFQGFELKEVFPSFTFVVLLKRI